MVKKVWIFLLFILGATAIAQAQDAVVITDDQEDITSLLDNVLILEDKNHEYNIKGIIANDGNYKFIPLAESDFNPGYAISTYWLKFTLKHEVTTPTDFFLEIGTPTLNVANLYYNEGNQIVERLSGDGIKFSEKDIKNRRIIVKVHCEPGKLKTYFVKIRADGENFNLQMRLQTHKQVWENDYNDQFFLGTFYGLVVFIVFIYLFFFIGLGDLAFIYYVLYVSAIGLLNVSLDGYVSQFLFPNNPTFVNRSSMMVGASAVIFGLLFVREFLDFKKHLPKFDKLVIGFIVLNFFILSMGFGPKWLFDISIPIISGTSSITTLFIIGAIITLIIKKKPFSPYFSFAYLTLTIGVFVYVGKNFGLFPMNFYSEQSLKIGTAAEMILLSISMVDRFRRMQSEKQKQQEILLGQLQVANAEKDAVNLDLARQTTEIKEQKEIIEEKNKDITESIRYSKRIQQAVLPSAERLVKHFPDSFILNKPKDIVGGDFAWFSERDKKIVVAAVDCTGHGVPGAFMSVIGNSFLNEIVNERKMTRPDVVLEVLRESIIRSLKQRSRETGEPQGMKDGMDIAVIRYDLETKVLSFSGAKNPLYLIRDGELIVFKGDRFPIGVDADGVLIPFEGHEIPVQKGDCVYIFSDGYPDQFGGPKGKKFKYKQFQELLLSIHDKEMEVQKIILEEALEKWRGSLEQVDDILVIGIRIED